MIPTRSAFSVTVRELAAMAMAAQKGVTNPAIASGAKAAL